MTKVNSTIRQWNTAQRGGESDRLDRAARRMGRTAVDLRGMAKTKNTGFNERARTVATELDRMKNARLARKSVDTGDFNIAQRSLHRYCTEQIQG